VGDPQGSLRSSKLDVRVSGSLTVHVALQAAVHVEARAGVIICIVSFAFCGFLGSADIKHLDHPLSIMFRLGAHSVCKGLLWDPNRLWPTAYLTPTKESTKLL
jgi:hypothetical protein